MQMGTPGSKLLNSAPPQTSAQVKEHLSGLGTSSNRNVTYLEDAFLTVQFPCHVEADGFPGPAPAWSTQPLCRLVI